MSDQLFILIIIIAIICAAGFLVACTFAVSGRASEEERIAEMREQTKKEGYHV